MGLNRDYYFQSMSNKYFSTDYFMHNLHYWNVSFFNFEICSLTFHPEFHLPKSYLEPNQ